MRSAPPSYIAAFDSSTAMLRALANYLHGRDFPLLATMPRWTGPALRIAGAAINHLPLPIREQIYIWSGWYDAIASRRLGSASIEKLADWVVDLYPERRYPAVMIGSSNGAAVHLCAVLGIPWLPQTFLVPVARSGVHPDEPLQDIEWADAPARAFLETNPDVQLHHMFDPNQDRLMIQRMTYFRTKRLRLGSAYEAFLRRSLQPGGTIFTVECGLRWPTTQRGDRHIFQFGALGGATVEEYLQGGHRVEEYLTRHRSHRTRWDPPEPDAQRAEAEWGFEAAILEDIENFARRHGFRIQRIIFEEPEDLSPLVCDLYRSWNQARGVLGDRLLVESFIVMEPYWAVRTGSSVFWMVFNKEPSRKALAAYLGQADAFDDIYLMLFSHGVNSIGLAPIEEWRELLGRAARNGTFVGVDADAYPRDFAVFFRYSHDLKRKIASRYPLPAPMQMSQLHEFVGARRERYRVQWL